MADRLTCRKRSSIASVRMRIRFRTMVSASKCVTITPGLYSLLFSSLHHFWCISSGAVGRRREEGRGKEQDTMHRLHSRDEEDRLNLATLEGQEQVGRET